MKTGPFHHPGWLLSCCLIFLLCTSVTTTARDSERVSIEIPIFVGGYGIQFWLDTARLFEEQHPHIKVNLYGDARIANKMRIRVIGGDFPDATECELPWVELIKAGKVVDLRPYLEGPNWEGDQAWGETFQPGSLDPWTLDDGGIYAVPFAYSIVGIYYNKKMFRENGWEIPETWPEFLDLCETIKAEGIPPVALTGIYARYIDNYLRSAHYSLVGPEEYRRFLYLEEGTRTHPGYIRAAELIQEIALNYLQPGWEGMSHTAAQLEFFQGNAAMVSTGSWLNSEMRGKIPEDFELGMFNFPLFGDSVAPASHVQTGAGYYYVFSESDHVEETVDFLRFLTSHQRAMAFAREYEGISAVEGIPHDLYSPNMQDAVAILGASTGSFSRPRVFGAYPKMSQALADYRMDLIRGRISPEAFARGLEQVAASIREAERHPNRVEFRYPFRGAALIAFLVGVFAFWFWRQKRRKQKTGDRRQFENSFDTLGHHHLLLFVGPAFLLYASVLLWPSLQAFAWSLTRWNGITEKSWAGWHHFTWLLFESDVFWTALGNNLFVMLVPGLVIIPVALVFAFWIHKGILGGRFFRICFLFPNILGGVAATLLWMTAYEPSIGLINTVLVSTGDFLSQVGLTWPGRWFQGFERFAWLSQERLYPSLVPILLWQGCGFNLILLLASMESIDETYYEAARLEGASLPRQFISITLPMIWDALLVVLVFWVIAGLNAFELIWLLTAQEPASTSHVLSTYMVNTLFTEFQVGRATAIAVTLFLLVFAGSLLTWNSLQREAVQT